MKREKNVRVPNARTLATVVGHEYNILSSLRLSIIKSHAVPVRSRRSRFARGFLRPPGLVARRRNSSSTGTSLNSRNRSSSRFVSRRPKPVVLPRDNLSVNSGNDHVGPLAAVGAVKMLMSVFMAGSDFGRGFDADFNTALFRLDFVALILGGEVVHGDLFDIEGSSEVKRELEVG